jgi:hypothetical protein
MDRWVQHVVACGSPTCVASSPHAHRQRFPQAMTINHLPTIHHSHSEAADTIETVIFPTQATGDDPTSFAKLAGTSIEPEEDSCGPLGERGAMRRETSVRVAADIARFLLAAANGHERRYIFDQREPPRASACGS